MYDDDWEAERWDLDLKAIADAWVSKVRRVKTIRFLELEDPTGHTAPAVQMGTPWYDRPDGTTDLERGAP